ncbi:hypothetical protein BaRGS_00017683, partial [Batillaria attramentaria]
NTSLPWDQRVEDLVNRLTVEEMQGLMGADGNGPNGGQPGTGIPRLGVAPFQMWSVCDRGDEGAPSGNATNFPQSIGLAASFSPSLVYRVSEAASIELRAMNNLYTKMGNYGIDTGLACISPVLDLFRDPRWGRNQETHGEDPYMVGVYGTQFVNAIHGHHPRYVRAIGECAHMAAYSGPENIPASRYSFDAKISERDLRMTFLPAFRACVEAGAYAVESSYNAINGVPAVMNEWLLTEVLRGEWNFTGFVLSDAGAVESVMNDFHYLNDSVDTAAACVNAGCNVELKSHKTNPPVYYSIVDAVKQGKIQESTLRDLVKPIFYARMRLGEFDPPEMNPFRKLDPAEVTESEEHQELAVEAALKSKQLRGSYAARTSLAYMTSPLQGLAGVASKTQFASGCNDTVCAEYNASAVRAAVQGAEYIFVMLGTGTAVEGEGHDRRDLELPGYQKQLLQDVVEASNQAPVILLLFSGGPLNISMADTDDRVSAIAQCFLPAQAAGKAVRHFLLNDVTGAVPAGRLPYTWPLLASQVPPMTNYSMEGRTYRYFIGDPLYPFGYGLSYVTFRYENLQYPASVESGEALAGSVHVTNLGDMEADEAVQVYISWQNTSLPAPKLQLAWFDRVTIPAGQTRTVEFVVQAKSMALWFDQGWEVPSVRSLKLSADRIVGQGRDDTVNTMSTSSSPTRSTRDPIFETSKSPERQEKKPIGIDQKLENRLNMKDLERLKSSFMVEGEGYDNKLSLTRDQFCEALSLLLKKGSREEYGELFDKIDVTREGTVDWDKFASHMLLEFYEKDDRVKSTQVPQWKDLKSLPSPHKEILQRVAYLKNTNRYIAISKEGCVSMWGTDLKPQRSLKTGTDSCKARDLWITHFVPLQNVNKIALAFTSKEIAIYDLSSKLEFNCQYKVQDLSHTPLCLDYWSNPNNVNEAILVWGDVGGYVNILFFNSANIALFERPPAPAGEKQEPCLNVHLHDILSGKYKNAVYAKYEAHRENGRGEWVREVKYSQYLECFISCATTTTNAVVIGWMEKHTSVNYQNVTRSKGGQPGKKGIQRKFEFNVSQGVNSFDYNDVLNLIATAGVNNHVCLWNPYVVSKPNGVLRGHMASVIQVEFIKNRGQLISFSKDKVLRIWDVQLQVCIQRLAGMFPKGPEVTSTLYFDDGKDRQGQERNRLFITFNYQITVLDMKTEVKDRIMSHEKPVVTALYNTVYNQVVSVCQAGTLVMWMVDSGQKVKQFNQIHGNSEVTCLSQDHSQTRLFTGSTDGTVKVWDFNGHCYHSLECAGGQPADIGQILVLKRSILVVGWAKCITEHAEDILCLDFVGPNTLASGSYDGEIVVWNTNSEHASRHMAQRSRRGLKSRGRSFVTTREPSQLTRQPTQADVSAAATTAEQGNGSATKTKQETSSAKSRAMSRASRGSTEDQNEFGWAVVKLIYLESRRGNSAGGGANLVSCGGNGWVRFWNSTHSTLLAEFVAHQHAGMIIMATDKLNQYLVTADVDGNVKVWDILEYATCQVDETVTEPPPMRSQFQPHQDMITSLEVFERNERLLVVSASSDCSVALWDIYGNKIGVFGQEEHWKIEPYTPPAQLDEDMLSERDREETSDSFKMEVELDSDWEPDDEAISAPQSYRINTWDRTVLGKDYQELRVQKRERRQPGTIPDLPYLHWERTGQPPAGPFSALDTKELDDVHSLVKPDAEKYFHERPGSSESAPKLPALAETLRTAFDEKSLFPNYILDFERNMKNYHAMMLSGSQQKPKNMRASLQNIGMQMGQIGQQPRGNLNSPRKSIKGGLAVKLKPIPQTRKSSISTHVE